MQRCSSPQFRRRFFNIVAGQKIIISSVHRTQTEQSIENAPKLRATLETSKCLLGAPSAQTVKDVANAANDDAVSGDAVNEEEPAGPVEKRNNEQEQQQPRRKTVFETQGGGKGRAPQTGKIVPAKPNNGRLPKVGRPKKTVVEKSRSLDSTDEYLPSDNSSVSSKSSHGRTQSRVSSTSSHGRTQSRVGRAHTETDAYDSDDQGDHSPAEEEAHDKDDDDAEEQQESDVEEDDDAEDSGDDTGDNDDGSDGEEDNDDDAGNDSEDDRETDEGDPEEMDNESEEEGGMVQLPPPKKKVRLSVPNESVPLQLTPRRLPNGFCELPPFKDLPEKNPTFSDCSDSDDGGNYTSVVTHLQQAANGTILVSDEADQSSGPDEFKEEGDPRRVVKLSKRSKFFSVLKEQKMKAFSRIHRYDEHEKGCFLSLGNPPNIFEFSNKLRYAAEGECRSVYESYKPFNNQDDARDVKFKEKVYKDGNRVTGRFNPKGAAVAEALHKYSTYALSALLKTAPLGSTFFEQVNPCSLAKYPSVSMMLRSQVDPYRTIFTCATSYVCDLHYEEKKNWGHPLPQKMLRMAVLEMIFRTKSICRSRVSSHKTDDEGVKIELAKRKARADKSGIDFE